MKKNLLTIFSCLVPMLGMAQHAERPNLIIIYCDDMGYGDLSCFGNPTIKTPHLDRMALEGQKWTSFYVSASVSSPSRAGLLTGRLGVRTGMYGNQRGVLFPNSVGGLPAEETTIGEILHSAGYQTACIGKWHVGHKEAYLPLNNGFDYFFGSPFSNDMSRREQVKRGNLNYPHEYIIYRQDKIVQREPDQTDLTKLFTSEAVNYINEHHQNPFFLYLAHPMPHFPVYASKAFQGKSERGKYGDTIEELDWSVGEILSTLKRNGIDRNTYVVFTSDNGPWLPYKLEAGTAGPLRDGKNSHYEGGFRVPCIVWGNGIDPGTITSMGSTLDIIPTFCDLLGIQLPTDRVYDGVSLLPVLTDHTAKSPRQTFFFYRGSLLYAVRKGNYKLHFMDREAYGSKHVTVYEKPVLYDLGSDPEERFNIADKYPEIVDDLKNLAKDHQDSFTPAKPIFDLK